MTRWEYYGIRLDLPVFPFKQLRMFGDEGWEAVCVVSDMLLMKRPKMEEATAVVQGSTLEEKCIWIRQLKEDGIITPAAAIALEERYGTRIL